MNRILRWHISRIYDAGDTETDVGRCVDVAITPAVVDRADSICRRRPKELAQTSCDQLDWWEPDEAQQLEGWTTEEKLLRAVTTRNLLRASAPLTISPEDRGLEEDMVFLYFVRGKSMPAAWNDLLETKGWPEVSALVDLKGARWLDFTQQARKMSAALYRQVLDTGKE